MRGVCLLAASMTLAACGQSDTASSGSLSEQAAAENAAYVPCAIGDADSFTPKSCTLEETDENGAQVWIVRHADGGFRRFRILDGGTRIATADGAEEVETERIGSELEVRVGKDRYRFPAAPQSSEAAPHASAS